jgi:anti-sigma B factor antagonist
VAELPTDVVAVVEVTGELDMASAEALRRAVRREVANGAAAAIVDLGRCPFFDSTGMSVMLELSDELGAKDVPLLLAIPSDPPARRRLVTLAGLELAFIIFESVDEAVASLTVEGAPAPMVQRRELNLSGG